MTNPIDPERLEAAALSYKAFWAANLCSTARTEDMVSAVLAADDQWRRDHPQCVRISYEWPDGVGWTINHSMQQAPAPHDAAKEVSPTGITPAANPTSGGNVEQEPELPEGFKFISDDGKWCEFQDRPDNIVCYPWAELPKYEAVCRWMRHRQRLQDKRGAATEVSDGEARIALRSLQSNGWLLSDQLRTVDHLKDAIRSVLNCRDEADGGGK